MTMIDCSWQLLYANISLLPAQGLVDQRTAQKESPKHSGQIEKGGP